MRIGDMAQNYNAQASANKGEIYGLNYSLFKAFDKMGGYLFEKHNINEQLEANTWEGTFGGSTGTFSNAQQVIDNNPVYKEFQILQETLQKADENGRTAFHEIGEMLTQGANATKKHAKFHSRRTGNATRGCCANGV